MNLLPLCQPRQALQGASAPARRFERHFSSRWFAGSTSTAKKNVEASKPFPIWSEDDGGRCDYVGTPASGACPVLPKPRAKPRGKPKGPTERSEALRHKSLEAEKSGVGNGNRTRNRRSHSPVLCQLSYSHRHHDYTTVLR